MEKIKTRKTKNNKKKKLKILKYTEAPNCKGKYEHLLGRPIRPFAGIFGPSGINTLMLQ